MGVLGAPLLLHNPIDTIQRIHIHTKETRKTKTISNSNHHHNRPHHNFLQSNNYTNPIPDRNRPAFPWRLMLAKFISSSSSSSNRKPRSKSLSFTAWLRDPVLRLLVYILIRLTKLYCFHRIVQFIIHTFNFSIEYRFGNGNNLTRLEDNTFI